MFSPTILTSYVPGIMEHLYTGNTERCSILPEVYGKRFTAIRSQEMWLYLMTETEMYQMVVTGRPTLRT
jgi:hypothetical protein